MNGDGILMEDDERESVASALLSLVTQTASAERHWLAPHRDAIVAAFDDGVSAARLAAALTTKLNRRVTREIVYEFVRANGSTRATPRKTATDTKGTARKPASAAPRKAAATPPAPRQAVEPKTAPQGAESPKTEKPTDASAYSGMPRRFNRTATPTGVN